MIFAVQTGAGGAGPDALSVQWRVQRGEAVVAQGTAPLGKGLADVSFSLAGLAPGRYDILAECKQGAAVIGKGQSFFRVVPATTPPQSGRVPIVLPRGVSARAGFPVDGGVPFPKGALWSESNVRVVRADGAPVPAQLAVRSRWGHAPETSVRWLGVHFQPDTAPAWWPDRQDVRYFLEFGPEVKPAASPGKLKVKDSAEGIEVDIGAMQFLVRRKPFTLLDAVRRNGKPVLQATPQSGLYLVDHEGSTYRAANDGGVELTIEEQGPERVTLRAEGWYVQDGSDGARLSYRLPTDKLCRFITRIEAYAGRPYVRVLHTWILTFDSFTVRLRDAGLSLPVEGCSAAEFGVEAGQPVSTPMPADGVHLVQHLPDRFDVADGSGKPLQSGRRSAGWVMAATANGLVTIGHRETWQRFPKELEVLPGALALHIWPAHGQTHPEIDIYARERIHQLWFAHQGRELNLAQPWGYYFAASRIAGRPDSGIYDPAGMAMAGVHSSAMGTAVTSDILIQFDPAGGAEAARDTAACFQAAPHALPDPHWLCGSLAMGYVHPYDPDKMKAAEETIARTMRAYWEIQDTCGEYGMWLYRTWHHSPLGEKGKPELYRLYNAAHHYDPFMPWMLYARSGDPFYLTQGSANMRLLTDVQVIHYNDPAYPQREFHGGEGRLVGSTRHTNGFNTWGGDHAILAHLTCYNSMMLAYYLTGDLRWREVVVDEWQKTLLFDRKNPEYLRADRTGSATGDTLRNADREGARDVTNALGELIDLYQLTYDPRVLAVMAPMMDYFLNTFMRPWGQPLQNVLLFTGSQQAREQLLAGVEEYRRANGRPADPKALWYTVAPCDNFAMASIIEPKTQAHVDAWAAADLPAHTLLSLKMQQQLPGSVIFCAIPDWIVYMPRVMYAVNAAGGVSALDTLSMPQAMPIDDTGNARWLRCVIKKDKPGPFDIAISGKVGKSGVPVRVFGPDNKLIVDALAPAGRHAPYLIAVADAREGEFVVQIKAQDAEDELLVPITAFPEVYCTRYWSQHASTRFFTRARGDAPESVSLTPYKGPGTLLGDDQQLLAGTDNGDMLKAEVGPAGLWILTQSRYVTVSDKPVILAVSRERWFAPSAEKLLVKP